MARQPFTLRQQGGTVQIGQDIRITRKQHDDLVKHIVDRFRVGAEIRDLYIPQMEAVDRDIAGWLRLDKDDQKRLKDNLIGRGPKPLKTNLQLTYAQLDEAVTFLASVIAPDDGIYTAIAPKEQQAAATGFAALMNKHAKDFKHFRNILKFCYSALKYNISGIITEWTEVYGSEIQDNGGSAEVVANRVVKSGNKLKAADMYNFIYDPSVDPVELPEQGEYFGVFEVLTPFRVRKLEAEGEFFGVDRFLGNNMPPDSELTFYKKKPETRTQIGAFQTGDMDARTNWLEILSASDDPDLATGIEIGVFYGWLDPKRFGLVKKTQRNAEDVDKFTIWRITVVQGKYIVAAEQLTNAHGQLPVDIAMPNDDNIGLGAPSYGEILVQLQRIASHELNTHVDSMRKKLFGITLYNQRIVNLGDAPDEMVNAQIPVNAPPDFDIRKAFSHITDAPDTNSTLDDIEKINSLMQKILPTQQQNQVASLERATQYQAAAVVQGSNRRNLKIAKLMEDQAMTNMRHKQMMNIYQFQESVEIISDRTGEVIQINPAEFRKAQLEFKVSDGLLGLDRLLLIETYKDLINMVIQNQVAIQQVDMIALLDYFTNILGDKSDFNQFRVKSPLDNLSPEEKQIAFQLFQQALQQQEQQSGGGGGGEGNVRSLVPNVG